MTIPKFYLRIYVNREKQFGGGRTICRVFDTSQAIAPAPWMRMMSFVYLAIRCRQRAHADEQGRSNVAVYQI